jgi:hypothetical protein
MEPATRNVDSASPLPLFRPEVLAARQNFHGEVLLIRPFSLSFLCLIGIGIAAVTVGFFSLAPYTPTAKVQGDVSFDSSRDAGHSRSHLTATFYVPAAFTGRIQADSRLVLHCFRCSHGATLRGIVIGVSPVQPSVGSVSSTLARSGPLRKVTVALSPVSLPPASAEPLQPGAKLEAEFPLTPRPLIRSLIGPAGS